MRKRKKYKNRSNLKVDVLRVTRQDRINNAYMLDVDDVYVNDGVIYSKTPVCNAFPHKTLFSGGPSRHFLC